MKGVLGSDRPAKQNHYFVESEHDHEAGPEGQGEGVSAAVQAGHTLPFLFGLTERNKITKVLLRWPGKHVSLPPFWGGWRSIKFALVKSMAGVFRSGFSAARRMQERQRFTISGLFTQRKSGHRWA